jgi:NADH dehydrogenase (ubiquinone) Fe-S protein 6
LPLRVNLGFANNTGMINEPEKVRVRDARISCDGSGDVPSALGHPKVWLQIDERGYVDCGYCDRRFVLIGGQADKK